MTFINRNITVKSTLGALSLSLLLFFSSFISEDVIPISWEDLSNVEYKYRPDLVNGNYFLKPFFDSEIKKLNGKKIKITGYVIPVDIYGDVHYLSSQPNSSCFFCGQAEKHSILALKLKDLPANYKMDEYLTFEGTLYTHTEQELLPYSLENATLVKED